METSAGSPRSSSGYGSSEEDHIRSSISAPQTPNSLSPLSSATIDLQTAFEYDDTILPDFSDLGALTDATNKFYCLADDWSAVNTPPRYSSNDDYSLSPIDDHVTLASFAALGSALTTMGVDDVIEGSESNILVSLLKQRSDVDATATSNHNGRSEPAKSQQSSPLQRLRALTRGNVVNNTELPVVVRPRIVINSSSNSLRFVKDSTDATVLRVGGVVGTPTASVRTTTEKSAFDVRSPLISSAPSSSARTDPMTPTGNSSSERKQSPLIADASSATRTTMSHPSAANRRHRSELEDHRYSSLHPVPAMTSSGSSGASRRASGGKRPLSRAATGRSGVVTGGRKTSSPSMLEALLLTNRTLKPNEGSEATLAACGVWSSANQGESSSASCPGDDYLSTGGPQAKRSCAEGSLLEHLLTGRTAEKNSTSGSETVIVKCEPMDDEEDKMASDRFDLFNGQLLYDDSPSDLGGLFGQDSSSVWTPAFFDEKVLSSELEEIMHQENRQEDAWLQHYLSDLL